MYSRKVTVVNSTGLHARPAAVFVKTAGEFQALVQISRGDKPEQKVNAKSMVLVLSLSASQGTEVFISAEGTDERAAVDTLTALIESGFDEMEKRP